MIAFAVLAVLAGLAWPGLSLLRIGIGLMLFGALIELAQMTPGLNRTADWSDWIADGIAVLAVLALTAFVRRRALAKGRRAG